MPRHWRLIGLPLVIGAFLLAAGAQAAECPGNATQIEALACETNANAAADARLARVESRLPDAVDRQSADAAYAAYRDAECRYEVLAFFPANVSDADHLTAYYGCQAFFTDERADHLQQAHRSVPRRSSQ